MLKYFNRYTESVLVENSLYNSTYWYLYTIYIYIYMANFLYENEKLCLLVILILYPATRWGNQFQISNLLLSVLCSHFVNSIKVIRRAICLSRSTILISYASFWCSSSNTLFTHTYMQNNLYFSYFATRKNWSKSFKNVEVNEP